MQSPIRLLPLIDGTVQAGFPSPAGDYLEGRIDLNEHLIEHPAATFLVWVSGDSMTGAGIYDGDLLVVDRSVQAAPGHIVVVAVDGELTLKRLARRRGRLVLQAENDAYPDIEVGEVAETMVWGVATSAIHFLAGPPPRGKSATAAE
jgi:DNA polymerase V